MECLLFSREVREDLLKHLLGKLDIHTNSTKSLYGQKVSRQAFSLLSEKSHFDGKIMPRNLIDKSLGRCLERFLSCVFEIL